MVKEAETRVFIPCNVVGFLHVCTYHNVPHTGTGRSPTEIIFLPHIIPNTTKFISSSVRWTRLYSTVQHKGNLMPACRWRAGQQNLPKSVWAPANEIINLQGYFIILFVVLTKPIHHYKFSLPASYFLSDSCSWLIVNNQLDALWAISHK